MDQRADMLQRADMHQRADMPTFPYREFALATDADLPPLDRRTNVSILSGLP